MWCSLRACHARAYLFPAIVLAISFKLTAEGYNHQTHIPELGNLQGFPCGAYGNVTRYLGVPYAQAPTGINRFAPPKAWEATYPFPARQATETPPKCPQPWNRPYDKISEDCLFLNIYTPFNASKNSIAVRVFFHGGWFASGSASDAYLNGCKSVAETNTTLVVVQYRLGALGFLSHPATLGESETTGNWGLMDQQMALQWINQYIMYFGGNSSIMLFGQNAGGISVALHYVMPASQNLFTSGITHSGAAITLKSSNDAYDQAYALAKALGCSEQDQLECLRAAKWTKILKFTPKVKDVYRPLAQLFYPVTDGRTIPRQPLSLINDGLFNTAPFMGGVNKDEGRTFVNSSFGRVGALTEENTRTFLKVVFPGVNPQQIIQQYWIGNYRNAFEQMSDIWTDIFIGCPTFKTLSAFAAYVFPPFKDCKPPFLIDRSMPCIVPVNLFYFMDQPTCPPQGRYLGASSTRELVYTLNLDNEFTGCSLNASQTKLAYDTTYAWGMMAKIRQPAFANFTPWALWTPASQTAMFLDGAYGLRYESINYAAKCALFDNLVLPPVGSPTIKLLPPGAGPVLPAFPLGLGLNGALPSPPPPSPPVKPASHLLPSLLGTLVAVILALIFMQS